VLGTLCVCLALLLWHSMLACITCCMGVYGVSRSGKLYIMPKQSGDAVAVSLCISWCEVTVG